MTATNPSEAERQEPEPAKKPVKARQAHPNAEKKPVPKRSYSIELAQALQKHREETWEYQRKLDKVKDRVHTAVILLQGQFPANADMPPVVRSAIELLDSLM